MKIYSEITTILNYGPKTLRVGKFKTFNEKKPFFFTPSLLATTEAQTV